MKLYGIRNCDTVKKARKWLDEQGITYEFHDFKKEGLDENRLSQWEKAVGWETLLNRRGTTWRKLSDEVRDTISAQSAHDIMLENTSIIKRPIVEYYSAVYVGFNADDWAAIIKKHH
ncbi:ArsC family reductase [Marinobacter salexigens]|uniref:ArsC family reductase n=1 Tax=Marinobacter salexigens TaxID=1925763 RepID=A0ABS6ABL9_9GAMM|nr:ArsC family reductase [Marinobacter salexigens]MBU2874582.1 ArsC family reductase [Marinobacter salexigens]